VSPQSRDAAPPGEAAAPEAHAAIEKEAVAELLAGLAHDLRSPLGVVSQALVELRTDLSEGLTAEHRLLVDLADRGLLRLGHLAGTLSLVAALEAGGFEIRRGPVDLVELLRSAVATSVAVERRREVDLACELPPGPCLALVDRARLSHAVSEVVINAIRHARRRALVTFELTPAEARVAVEDDGAGVSAERRATLFRRLLVRGSLSGLGLGLSIAHDVIVAHGGCLTLEPSTLPPGRPGTIGARFLISLPLEGGA